MFGEILMIDITMADLMEYSEVCTDLPWGMGHEEFEGNSEIWAPYARFLYLFAKEYEPLLTIECGVYMATVTEHMALANPNGLVIGIDRQFHPAAYNVVRRQRNVRFVHGDTLDSFEHVKLFYEGRPLELLFLDSTHDGVTPSKEFDVYQPLMGEQCLVACDDILENDEMKAWWDSIGYPKMELHHLHPYPAPNGPDVGFGVFIYER
jgi:cephalosporin hydroxylase